MRHPEAYNWLRAVVHENHDAAVVARTDLVAEDAAPEHVVHRNVTMIPARGARVIVAERRAA